MTRTPINLLLAIAFFFFYSISTAQERTILVKGILVDSLTNQLIPDATVTLLRIDQSQQTRSTKSGTFLLETDLIARDLEITHLNYHRKKVHIPDTVSDHIDLGLILLNSKANTISTVEITGAPPTIERKIDRITYNVQSDPDKDVYNALNMLQKVPLISVDGQDNLALKGKSNFKLLINGKPSALFSGNPSIALKAMPSKDIQRIEVITSPPAKYDAEGIAGLINIVTKKEMDNGYDIYVGASYMHPLGPLASLSANAKKDRLQFSIMASGSMQETPFTSTANNIYFHDGQTVQQQGQQKFEGNTGLIRGEILFDIDSLNMLSLAGSWTGYNYDMESEISNHQSGAADDYTVFQNGSPYWNTADLDFNYQRGFKNNPKEFLNFSYKYLTSRNAVRDNLHYTGINWDATEQNNDFGYTENSLQIDYEKQPGNLLLESGGKFVSRNSTSMYEYGATSTLFNNDEFNFNYDVFNLYQTIGYEKGNWSYKGGLRMDLMTFPDNHRTQEHKFNLLPSLAIQRKIGAHHSINGSYNERITRPNISQMSPFSDRSNPNFVSVGNPLLSPTKGHNYNLSYSYINKLSIITDFGYYYTNNAIEQVFNAQGDSLINISYANIGRENSYDANLNLGYTLKNIRMSLNGSLSYVELEGLYKDVKLKNEGLERNMSFNMSIPISSSFRSNVSIRHTGPNVFLQGKSNSFTGYSISFTKQLLKKKMSIFASVNNPFKTYYTRRHDYSVPEFDSHTFVQQNYRSFVFSISYSFGSADLKTKNIKKKVENNDQNSFEINPLK